MKPLQSAWGKSGLLFLAALCFALIAATSRASQPAAAASPSGAAGSGSSTTVSAGPVRGGTLRIAQASVANSLDVNAADQRTLNEEAEYIYDTLFDRVSGGKVVPWLVAKESVSKNGLVVTWQLHPGVRFHDGTSLNAAAVVWNLQRKIKKKLALADLLPIKSLAAHGPGTVVVRLTRPFSSLDDYLAARTFSIYSPTFVRKHGDAGLGFKEAGSGPFMLKSFSPGQSLTLVRFPGYWKKGLPYFDEVRFQNVPDEHTRFAELQSGQVQMALDLNYPDIVAADKKGSLKILSGVGSLQYYGAINCLNPNLDVKVRQAINYAVDKAYIAKSIFQGYATPAHSVFITPALAGYVSARYYAFSTAKAKQLLTADGWTAGSSGTRTKNGQQLSVNILTTNGGITGDYAITQLVQAELQSIGIKAKISIADASTVYTKLNSGQKPNYDIFITATSTTSGELTYNFKTLYLSSSVPPTYWNYSWFKDPTTDKLIRQTTTVTSPSKLRALYAAIQRRQANQAPILMLDDIKSAVAMSKSLNGVYFENAQTLFPAKFGWLSH
jgi:glutathione transport system substrate-binding protein